MWFKGDRANIRTNIWKTASCVWTASCHKFSKFKCVSAILWPWSPHSITAYCACDVSSGGWSLPTQTRLSPLTHLCQISHSGLGCRVINGGSIPDLIPLSVIVNSYWCCDNQIQWGHQGLMCHWPAPVNEPQPAFVTCHECNVSPRDHVTQPRDACHNDRIQLMSKHVF